MVGEASISFVWDKRVLATIGTNDREVAASFNTTSLNETLPDTTSSSPNSAPGASARDNDGLRRSQSSRIALPPACETRRAKLATTVDFPSPGCVDVIPMALFGLARESRSIPTLMLRN